MAGIFFSVKQPPNKMENATPFTATFRGLDGFAGFIHGRTYTTRYRRDGDDDERGGYLVEMPHAPGQGPARFR